MSWDIKWTSKKTKEKLDSATSLSATKTNFTPLKNKVSV
jgi:hypothetical protein